MPLFPAYSSVLPETQNSFTLLDAGAIPLPPLPADKASNGVMSNGVQPDQRHDSNSGLASPHATNTSGDPQPLSTTPTNEAQEKLEKELETLLSDSHSEDEVTETEKRNLKTSTKKKKKDKKKKKKKKKKKNKKHKKENREESSDDSDEDIASAKARKRVSKSSETADRLSNSPKSVVNEEPIVQCVSEIQPSDVSPQRAADAALPFIPPGNEVTSSKTGNNDETTTPRSPCASPSEINNPPDDALLNNVESISELEKLELKKNDFDVEAFDKSPLPVELCDKSHNPDCASNTKFVSKDHETITEKSEAVEQDILETSVEESKLESGKGTDASLSIEIANNSQYNGKHDGSTSQDKQSNVALMSRDGERAKSESRDKDCVESHSNERERARSKSLDRKQSEANPLDVKQNGSESRDRIHSKSRDRKRDKSTSRDRKRDKSKSRDRKRDKSTSSDRKRNKSKSRDRTRRRSRSLARRRSRSHRGRRSASKSSKNKRLKSRSRSRTRAKRSHSRNGRLRSRSRDRARKSPSRSRDRARKSRSRSKNRARKSRSRSRDRTRKSRSRSRDKARKSRSRSKDRARKSRSRSRDRARKSRSRSRDKARKSRSRSKDRARKSRSRSRDQARKSRSRSRDKARKSRSRSKDRARKSRSRSRDKARKSRSRSRDKARKSRSRSNRKKLKKSRSRSNSRNRRSRPRRSRRSQSRIRKRSRSSGDNGKSRKRSKKSRDKSSDSLKPFLLKNYSSKPVFAEISSYIKPESVLFLETSGDKNNFAFPTTHYTQLVKYKAMKKVLGAENFLTDDYPKKSLERYFQKKMRSQMLQNAVVCRPIEEIETDEDIFKKPCIPVELTYAETVKVRKLKAEEKKDAYEKSSFYLDSVDVSNGKDDAVDAEESEYDFYMKQSKSFNERLAKDTKNESLWLEFVQFQDKAFPHLFRGGEGGERSSKNSQSSKKGKSARALAERKIALLDAAIKKNPHSLTLQLERLAVGEEVWELQTLNKEWTTLVYNFPNNMTVWQRYIEHHATSSLQFRVTSAVAAASRCLEKLRLMATGAFVTHAPPQHPGLCAVDVIAQVSSVWAQSGYRERAVGLWQAVLEYNLFTPDNLAQLKHEDKLPLLEQFWDSRAPRIGEEGSLGWGEALKTRQGARYTETILEGQFDEEDKIVECAVKRCPILRSQGPEILNDSEESEDDEAVDKECISTEEKIERAAASARRRAEAEARKAEYEGELQKLWLQLEVLREKRYWLPYAADPDDCEDPERMVGFELLSPFVFPLPLGDNTGSTDTTDSRYKKRWLTDDQHEKFYLVLRFLQFLGVDTANIESIFFEYLQLEDYSADTFDNLKIDSIEGLLASDVPASREDFSSEIDLLPTCGPSLADPDCDKFFNFVSNVIERSMLAFQSQYSSYLAVLFIRIMIQRYKAIQKLKGPPQRLQNLEKSFKKAAKNLLKKEEFRSSLLLYREYGALEECFGNVAEAENVYINALVLGSKGSDVFEKDPDTFRILSSVTWSYLKLHLSVAAEYDGDDASVHTSCLMSVLCELANEGCVSSTEAQQFQPSSVLRARKKYAELLELALLTFIKSKKLNTCNNAIIVELCTYLGILQYLASGIKAFCTIFEETIARIVDCDNPARRSGKATTLASLYNNMDTSVEACNTSLSLRKLSNNFPWVTGHLLQGLFERYAWLCIVLPRVTSQGVTRSSDGITPAKLKLVVQQALVAAPDSSLLLTLQATMQNWRELFSGGGGERSTIRQLVFRVLPHLASARRVAQLAYANDSAVCVSHTVLSVLRSVVLRAAGQHNPLLWRLYLHWSGLMKRTSQKTNSLLYSALTACPASKSVYLSGIDSCETSPVLRSTVRLMEERGLRCRLPLQELQLLLQEEQEEEPASNTQDIDVGEIGIAEKLIEQLN
ncbi:nuclear exosome regulator NRDE2 isoform X2 [Hyalella azteca]|uniref:Nuclear exosome regulator NRDE2 isoform X2 n=1 Tax=Hyalella azteca TaxID=294128 RepID=A0A979FKA9_HYAAZ|nr:nuclear exosome regulator NRDE2 isoform X2 [Hyalella azteca]